MCPEAITHGPDSLHIARLVQPFMPCEACIRPTQHAQHDPQCCIVYRRLSRTRRLAFLGCVESALPHCTRTFQSCSSRCNLIGFPSSTGRHGVPGRIRCAGFAASQPACHPRRRPRRRRPLLRCRACHILTGSPLVVQLIGQASCLPFPGCCVITGSIFFLCAWSDSTVSACKERHLTR